MKNIKKLRAKMDISQEDLAKMVGVSRTTLNTWENSATVLCKGNEEKLLDIFKCNIYELYGMDEFKHYPKDSESKIGIIAMLYNLLEQDEKEKLLDMLQSKLYE
jgi:DNA-binding XRE family transcriptional regulator